MDSNRLLRLAKPITLTPGPPRHAGKKSTHCGSGIISFVMLSFLRLSCTLRGNDLGGNYVKAVSTRLFRSLTSVPRAHRQ